MNRQIGQYLVLDETRDGNLLIELTPAGRVFLAESVAEINLHCGSIGHPFRCALDGGCDSKLLQTDVIWNKSHTVIWGDLLEDIQCNSQTRMLSEYDTAAFGHLTSAPIIVTGFEDDDQGNAVKCDKTFWFESYAVESELETLLSQGEVVFDGAN